MMHQGLIPAIVCSVVMPAAADDPPVFSQAGFDADRAAAIEQDRLHLVYATAVWCGPCQQMKKTTWVDPAVESWAAEHAIVTPLDVDDFPEKAQELGIRAMPTMMLFEGDDEIGRAMGYRSADQLAAWMEGVRTGEIELGNNPMMPFGAGGGPADPVIDKINQLQSFINDEDFASATDVVADLWETMLDDHDHYVGVRLSVIPEHMKLLVDVHPGALNRFTAFRDREAAKLEAGEIDWDTLTDWVYLNGVIGDEAATVAWAERIASRDNAGETFSRYDTEIVAQAKNIGRWDILPVVIADPTGAADEAMQQLAMMRMFSDHIEPLKLPDLLAWHFQGPIAAALHADDGGAKERALVGFFETASPEHDAWRIAFITVANGCGQLREDHTAWIERYDLDEQFPEQAKQIEPQL